MQWSWKEISEVCLTGNTAVVSRYAPAGCRLLPQPPLMDDETLVGAEWRGGVGELEPVSGAASFAIN